jgi:hypothetical protein
MLYRAEDAWRGVAADMIGGVLVLLGKKDLTVAQVMSLNTVPQILAPAPGLNFAYLPVYMTFHKPRGLSGYTVLDSRLVLTYRDPGGEILMMLGSDNLLSTTSPRTEAVWGLSNNPDTPISQVRVAVNEALCLQLMNNDIVDGDSGISVQVYGVKFPVPPYAPAPPA